MKITVGPPAPKRRSRRRSTPTVRIDKDTVFIGGSGYSVAPSLQESFIRRKTGGRGSSARRAIQQAKEIEIKRQAEMARKAAEMAEAKSFAEKIRIAKQHVAGKQAEAERIRILNYRTNLINRGAKADKRSSRDVKTGDQLVVTQWRLKNGDRVEKIENKTTGETVFSSFKRQKGRGPVRQTGGVSMDGIKPDPRLGEQLVAYNPKKVDASLVRLDAGFNSHDLGRRVQGIERISLSTKREARELIKKLDSGQGLSAKDKAVLLGLQFAIPSQELVLGLKQLPGFASSLAKNPKNIIQVPGQIYTALKETGLEIVALAKVSPALAIARIGGEIITLKIISGALKVTGKVTGTAAKSIAPALKPIRGGSLIAKTATKKGVVKLRVVTKKTGRAITKRSKTVREAAKVVREVKVARKKVKAIQKIEIKKFKSAVEYKKQLSRARKVRRLASKKGRTISIGNRDYINAVAFVEDFADKLATFKAKQYLKQLKDRGVKLGLGQEEEFINAIRKMVKKNLNDYPTFKNLKNAAKLTEPFQIKLMKTGKLISAKKLAKKISSKIDSLPISKKMNSLFKSIKSKIKVVRKAPKKIKRKIVRARLVRKGKREFRKTNRYRMEKARKNRKVSLDQLNRAKSINTARKLVDNVFDEVAKRQKVKLDSLKYRQFKNVVKKRISLAIRTGNVVEINKFRIAMKKVLKDVNKPASQPLVRIVEKGTRKYKTIKDFKPETPKGQYIEVKSGQQVMLQQVKQVQKLAPRQQVYVIQSVSKKSANLMPLIRFATDSISIQAFKSLLKLETKQVLNTAQLSKSLQASAQDFKVLQDIGQAMTPRLNVRQAVMQDVAQKLRAAQKLRTKQVTKKKLVVKRLQEKLKNVRLLRKKVMTYAFIVRKAGKNVRLKIPPMTLQDAWNVGAYRLDHDLQRTGTLIPVGMTKKVAVISKNMKGYYGKHKKKFRRFRVKKGKKFTLKRTIIENRKYVGDLRSEQIALKRAARKRAKTRRRKKPVKKVISRKKLPTLNRLKSTKKELLLKRKRMINKLKRK